MKENRGSAKSAKLPAKTISERSSSRLSAAGSAAGFKTGLVLWHGKGWFQGI